MCWWTLVWDNVSRALLSAFRHGFIATPVAVMFEDVGIALDARWLMIRVRWTLFTICRMSDISGDTAAAPDDMAPCIPTPGYSAERDEYDGICRVTGSRRLKHIARLVVVSG